MAHNVSNLFSEKEVELYGLYKNPLYAEEKSCYFQSLFIEGYEGKANLSFIKICPKSYSSGTINSENNLVVKRVMSLFNENTLPAYDKKQGIDNEEFLLHGVKAKVLFFLDEIVAISNLDAKDWFKINRSIPEIGNFELWKKNLIKNKIEEYKIALEKLKRTPECDYVEYVKLNKLLTELKRAQNN